MAGQDQLLDQRLGLSPQRNANGFQFALPGLIQRCAQEIALEQTLRAEDHIPMFLHGGSRPALIV